MAAIALGGERSARRAAGRPAPTLCALAFVAGCGAPFPPQQSIVVRRPVEIYLAHLDDPMPVGAYRTREEAPPEVDGLRPARCQALCGDVLPGRTVLSCRNARLDAPLAHIDPAPRPVSDYPYPGKNPEWVPNEWILCSFAPAAPSSSSSAQEKPR